MARHALKTPALVSIAAVAVAIGGYSFSQRKAVPPCAAPPGQFCLQLELDEDPYYEDDNRQFDLIAINEGDIDSAFADFEVRLPSGDPGISSSAWAYGMSQAEFDAILTDYRISRTRGTVLLHLVVGNYYVCTYTPKPSSLQAGPNSTVKCSYIQYGHEFRMEGNTYVETHRTDDGGYGMERE